jgi:hypothetical protein
MTPHGTAGQDGENGQEAAERKLAAAANGGGSVSAKTPRWLTTIPPDQRASDSHDDTRLATLLKVLNTLFFEHPGAFKESGHRPVATALREPGFQTAGTPDDECMTTTCDSGYTSQ